MTLDLSVRGTVWLLEDSPLEAGLAQRALVNHATMSLFFDGASLIERLSSSEPPNVLLLDWRLPGLSGIEVCAFVRAQYDKLALPILMLTVQGSKEDMVAGLAAGANDYVTKPYNINELQARVMNLVEISRSYRQIKHLEEERSVQEAMLRERVEFEKKILGIVSHDLRNPISVIKMRASALLRRGSLEEGQLNSVRGICGATERVERMLDDLMDFTEARFTGGVSVNCRKMNIHDLAGQMVEEMRAGHPHREVQLTSWGEGHGQWDPDRLAQVLFNLLNNALKYSPSDSIVHIETHGDAEGVSLRVRNSGVPISPELLPHVFKPLQRGSQPTAHEARSVGLGLYIVERIVHAHCGTVDVVSGPEDGTIFAVHLPRTCQSTLALPVGQERSGEAGAWT